MDIAALTAGLERELRAGGVDFELLAARMAEEKEFFIRKAIGWILRDVSQKRPDLAFQFLSFHLREVAGITLREGSKHPSDEQQGALNQTRRRVARENS